MTRRRPCLYVPVMLVALTVLVCASIGAAPAAAAPPTPTISLAELRNELIAAPSGTLSGHFKTVLRGSAIENIPLTVLAVIGGPTDELDPNTALVLFEAYGPAIERHGGISSGMSGSPVYVNVRGVDRLVGALAYGEAFTRGGAALATPIDAMSQLESGLSDAPRPLGTPVVTASGVKDGVVIAPDVATADLMNATGQLAMRPLTTVCIGGVDPRSVLYRSLAEDLEEAGLGVLPLSAPLQTGSERFTTPLVPGAALAALVTRGDAWVGALGTVTYTNGPSLLAFGHPVTGEGPTELYLSNAWVDGVWPSLMAPHKVGTPGAMRGTITLDANAGVLGHVGETPDDVVLTAYARRSDTGTSKRSRVAVPGRILNSNSPLWKQLAPLAVSPAPLAVYGAMPAPGSAVTTTTVVLTDGVLTRSITRENVFDSEVEAPIGAVADAAQMIWDVQSVIGGGVTDVRILSVDVTSAISAKRSLAEVRDVRIDGGLRHGANRVTVLLTQYGEPATRTIDVTLTVPAGLPLTGSLIVSGPSGSGGPVPAEAGQTGDSTEPSFMGDRRTFDQLVRDLESAAPNNQLRVAYSIASPAEGGYSGPNEGDAPTFPQLPDSDSVEATALVPWVLASTSVGKSAASVSVAAYPRRVGFGGSVTLSGEVSGGTAGTVEVFVRDAGQREERLVATATVRSAGDQSGTFRVTLPRLRSTAFVRLAYSGDERVLGSQARLTVPVASLVSLSASDVTPRRGRPVTLTAAVQPSNFGGTVVFERLSDGAWRTIARRTARTGTVSARFTPNAGITMVRARAVGSMRNAAGVSRTLTLRVQ